MSDVLWVLLNIYPFKGCRIIRNYMHVKYSALTLRVYYYLYGVQYYVDKFPLLDVNVMRELCEEEKDSLLTRLNAETKSICLLFGGLVAHTEKSLQNSNNSAENLVTFFRNSELEDLANSIQLEDLANKIRSDSIPTVLTKVKKGGYWSFFNYEVLENMIHYYCDETPTVKHLDNYISKFKEYCQRRVSEVPAGTFTGDMSSKFAAKVFKVKLDQKFSISSPLDSIKHVQYRIQQILNRKPIVLVGVEDGCIQLSFRYFDAMISVGEKETACLTEIGVHSLTHIKRSSGQKKRSSGTAFIPLGHSVPGKSVKVNAVVGSFYIPSVSEVE